MPLSLSRSIRESIENPAFDLDWVTEKYLAWVAERTYLVLGKYEKVEGFKSERSMKEVFKAIAVKHSKRGNDVYAARVRKRFKGLKVDEEVRFFDEATHEAQKVCPNGSIENRESIRIRKRAETCCLFATLTYDVKRCDWRDAWKNISAEWNKFMSNIRAKFGKISTIRTFESFKNGYPHIHAILLFDAMWFDSFKDRKGVWRIDLKDFISSYWHSHVDIKAMYYLQGALTYIGKYVQKCSELDVSEIKVVRTLACCWIFRKRSFSVSGEFRGKLHDLIVGMHISKRIVQSELSGKLKVISKWFVLCRSVLGETIEIMDNDWWVELSEGQIELVPILDMKM